MSRLSTKHAVLGLMVERPTYGYRLVQDVSKRLPFLQLGVSAVYKVMERLEAEGWIEEVGERSTGRTRRGVPRVQYQATAAGLEEFRRWMREPSERPLVRDELHAKLALSEPDDIPALMRSVERQTAACFKELAGLQRPSLTDVEDVPWNVAARMMVDDYKARSLEGAIDWLTEIARLMEQRMASDLRASSGA